MDLDAYLARIGHDDPVEPTLGCLRSLHLAHALAIPFENLDILLGVPIRLDLDSLQRKLVDDRRGGYCFEQNALFAAALEAIGFDVTPLAARVRSGRRRSGARSHMLLRVADDGAPWLADVGFGGDGLVEPIPFDPGQPAEQFGWRYRLVQDGSERVMQTWSRERWVDQYAFTLEPQLPIDYEVANHYTSTHPASGFTRTLTAQRPQRSDPSVRWVLRGRTFAAYGPDGRTSSHRVADEALLEALADRFDLRLPPGTLLP